MEFPYYMLKRFVELEDAIRSTLAFTDKSLPSISPEDWFLYNQLCQVLRPFEEICTTMSGEKYATGISVIIVTRYLKEACKKLLERNDLFPEVTNTVLLLKTGLDERFRSVETSATFALCTFMDPRFKMQGFSDQFEAASTKEKVRKLVASLIAEDERTKATISTGNSTVTENNSNNSGPIR